MNTLRNEIWNLEIKTDHAGYYLADESVDAILLAIKNRLPKEQGRMPQLLPNGVDAANYQWGDGFNTCLAEVKQALDIESES